MSENPYQIFKEELPTLFESFNELVEARKNYLDWILKPNN